jgi:hypothetical protein
LCFRPRVGGAGLSAARGGVQRAGAGVGVGAIAIPQTAR